MPRDPEPTRRRILDAALELFAEKGITGVSQREIRIAAGQRNVNVIQYHFGDVDGLLTALLERERVALEDRRAELVLEMHDLRSAGAVIVAPFAEFATGSEHERRVVRFLAQLYADPELSLAQISAMVRVEARDVAMERIRTELAHLPREVLAERVIIAIGSFIHAASLRARRVRGTGRSDAEFRSELVDMFVGAISAPHREAVDTK